MTSGGQRYGYTYDSMGNIATYTAPDGEVVTYTYDNQGQLLKAAGNTTYTYTYDGAGNLLTTSNGTATHSYTYGDANWKDLLTAFDGQSITYDSIGNPTSYYNGIRWNFTWANGRSLATATAGSNSLSFTYDASGLRTSKVVNGTTYRYYYAGGKLMRMTWGTNTIDFFYDANGTPYAMKYNGTVYYYVTNLQGDVMRIVDGSQNTVTSYDYDPFARSSPQPARWQISTRCATVGMSTTGKLASTTSRAGITIRQLVDLSMRTLIHLPGRALLDIICSHIAGTALRTFRMKRGMLLLAKRYSTRACCFSSHLLMGRYLLLIL